MHYLIINLTRSAESDLKLGIPALSRLQPYCLRKHDFGSFQPRLSWVIVSGSVQPPALAQDFLLALISLILCLADGSFSNLSFQVSRIRDSSTRKCCLSGCSSYVEHIIDTNHFWTKLILVIMPFVFAVSVDLKVPTGLIYKPSLESVIAYLCVES